MRALQIIFLLSFAVFVLVIPYLIFSLMQGGSDGNTTLIIFVALIFAVNAFFIIRKLWNLKKEKPKQGN